MDDLILDILLAHNGLTKDALPQLVDRARENLAHVLREWAIEPQGQ